MGVVGLGLSWVSVGVAMSVGVLDRGKGVSARVIFPAERVIASPILEQSLSLCSLEEAKDDGDIITRLLSRLLCGAKATVRFVGISGAFRGGGARLGVDGFSCCLRRISSNSTPVTATFVVILLRLLVLLWLRGTKACSRPVLVDAGLYPQSYHVPLHGQD